MASPAIQDLFALDRDVARAAQALAKHRAKLDVDPASVADEDPFVSYRHVASRTTWRALTELAPSAIDRPLHAGLLRWIEALVEARVGLPEETALAEAKLAPEGRFDGSPPERVSFARAMRELGTVPRAVQARLWLAAAAGAADGVASARRVRASKRVEVAARMGRAHPWEAMVPFAPAALRASASALLDATEDIARAVWKEAIAEDDGAAARIVVAGAREAGDGWPARITTGFFLDVFGDGARRLPIAPRLVRRWPQPVSAASFARALTDFGFAVRLATAPSALPFVLARDPAFVSGYRVASVFGGLAANPTFYLKGLRTSRRAALGQARALARTALLEARTNAARLLLGDDAMFAPRDRFEELAARVFGGGLDTRLRGAFPAVRDDEPARWVGLLEALALRDALRAQFDDDWFRNPRAWSHLEGLGTHVAEGDPPAPPPDALDASAKALGRAFEEALG
jgi:hypothetical protein